MKQIHKVLSYDYIWQIAMDADIQALDGWELVSYHVLERELNHDVCTAIYRKSVTGKEYKKWREKEYKKWREKEENEHMDF